MSEFTKRQDLAKELEELLQEMETDLKKLEKYTAGVRHAIGSKRRRLDEIIRAVPPEKH